MTDLPNLQHLVGGTATEAEFQGAMSDLYEIISEIAGVQAPEDLSITLGAITPNQGFCIVDTENAAPTDTLSNIASTNLGEKILILQAKSTARPIVLQHNASGSGKISLIGGVDASLSDVRQLTVLRYNDSDSTWYELWNNYSIFAPTASIKALVRDSIGVTDVATKSIGTLSDQIPTASLLGGLAFLSTITSNQLGSNSVITSKILDRNVTLNKMAQGSPGKYIGYNTQGNPVALDVDIPNPGGREMFDTAGTFSFDCSEIEGFVKVTVHGAGGGGGHPTTGGNGNAGGRGETSAFGEFVSATGGFGGLGAITSSASSTRAGGTGIDGDFNYDGEAGTCDDAGTSYGGLGAIYFGSGTRPSRTISNNTVSGPAAIMEYGSGGASGQRYNRTFRPGAGGGGMAIKWVDVTNLQTVEVIVGEGGIRGGTNSVHGTAGFVMIEW